MRLSITFSSDIGKTDRLMRFRLFSWGSRPFFFIFGSSDQERRLEFTNSNQSNSFGHYKKKAKFLLDFSYFRQFVSLEQLHLKNKMDNNEVPGGWNSEDAVLGHLSCEEVARFGATFISTLRMIWSGRQPTDIIGMSRCIAQLLEHQNALFGSDVAKKNSELFADKAELIGLMAICMAGVCADAKIDPRSISNIAYTLMNGVVEMAKNTGPLGDDDIILVDVRKDEEGFQADGSTKIQIALRVEATKTIDDIISSSVDATTMMKMVREVNPIKPEDEKKTKNEKRRKKTE